MSDVKSMNKPPIKNHWVREERHMIWFNTTMSADIQTKLLYNVLI